MFFEKYVELCNDVGRSPNSVAKELGISSGAVTAWKQGRIPYASTLKKIADYFGVSTAYLLVEEEKEKAPSGRRGVKVPVYGSVAAGIPIEAITDIEDYEEISEK